MEIRNKCLNPLVVPKITGDLPLLRCGKCVGCLKQKSNELAVRAFREFVGQDVAFLTFTYRNECCPIYLQRLVVNTATGEVVSEDCSIQRNCGFFENAPYIQKMNKHSKVVNRYFPLVVESDDHFSLKFVDIYYQTVYYEDMKKLFKRFRYRYPNTLKKFICCQEYGAVGYRPHYHLLVYGLSKEQIQYLVDDWSKNYGSVDVRFPNTNDAYEVEKISAYIAKYCNKGSFDCPFIKDRVCLKPKRSSSIGFGKGCDFEKLVQYVLASEITGIKDVHINPDQLDDSTLRILADRRKYKINGYPYPFPKYLIKLIFYDKVKVYNEEGVVYRYRATPLQKAITSIILGNLASDAEGKREQTRKKGALYSQSAEHFKNMAAIDEIQIRSSESAFIAGLEASSIY